MFLLDSLVELGTINKKEKKKLFLIIYTNNGLWHTAWLEPCKTRKRAGGERNVSHNFTVKFHPPIDLPTRKTALNRLITMSYSWKNIDSRYDNNKIRWKKKNGTSVENLNFPEWNVWLHRNQHTGKVDPTNKDSNYIFTIHFEFSTYRILILVYRDYELDLSQGNFNELLGYNKRILTGDSFGDKVPNITRGVDWVYLHCDLISRRTNNVSSDVLNSFSTSDLRVSYPFRKEPRRLEWQPVNKSYIMK